MKSHRTSEVRYLLLLVLATHACARPARIPLPAPAPLVRGGTPVPGKGVGLGIQLGDGLQGQELLRKELFTGDLMIGVADRVNFSIGAFTGHRDEDPDGLLISGKVRLGGLSGRGTNSALYAGLYAVDRREAGEQDESLTTVDLALPVETLLNDVQADVLLSVYGGPRALHESYTDHLRPSESFDDWLPGVLGGIHVALGHVHLFAEASVLWRPENQYLGDPYGGSAIVLPSTGLVAHVGPPFRWNR